MYFVSENNNKYILKSNCAIMLLQVKACDNVYRILLILIRLDWSINILYRISSISAVVKSHIFARGRISGYEKRITYFDGNPNSSY